MKMNDLYILHLSDLHFQIRERDVFFSRLKKDIETRLSGVSRIVVAITGDIVNLGEYGCSAKEAKKFFRELYAICSDGEKREVDLEIVPGNHDVIRPKFGTRTWKVSYRQYENLERELYDCFKSKSKPRIGISCYRHQGSSIVFVRTNSACCLPEKEIESWIKNEFTAAGKTNDEAGIKNAKAQWLADIKKEMDDQAVKIKSLYDRKIAKLNNPIVIALSHYPLNWLRNNVYEDLRDTLFDKGLSFVNFWMCGHLHDAQYYYANQNSVRTVMLTSGIGLRNGAASKHRYSIYRIGAERNVCAAYMRYNEGGGRFDVDTEFRRTNEVDRYGCFTLPISCENDGTIFHLNSSEPNRSTSFYVDEQFLKIIPEVSSRLNFLQGKIGDALTTICCDIADCAVYNGNFKPALVFPWVLNDDMELVKQPSWKSFFCKNSVQNEWMYKYLISICGLINATFALGSVEEGICEHGSVDSRTLFGGATWRAHFRKYERSIRRNGKTIKDVYVCICSKKTGGKKALPRDVQWDGLIKRAYSHPEKTLIESANRGVNRIKTDWDDFLTSIPNFRGNEIAINKGREKRPILTFGISIKANTFDCVAKASRMLAVLEFLRINDVIGSAINEFLRKTGVGVNVAI